MPGWCAARHWPRAISNTCRPPPSWAASERRIILRHVLPNCIQPALIYVFTGMVLAVMTGATLSFLGLGVQPPTPEWGAMIAEGRQFLLLAWWMPTFPGIALLIVGVALSLIGDGLSERR